MEAILRAREREAIPDMPYWSMEDHLVAIAERVDHMHVLGSDLPLAAIAAFRALWPEMEVPKEVSELSKWVKAAEARLSEWRDSAGRVGIFKALQIVFSWYEGISFDSLGSIHADSEYYTDDAAKKRLEEAACKLLEFADVHSEFFEDVNEAKEREEADEDEEDNAGGAGDGDNAGGAGNSEQTEDPNELLISDIHRQRVPASDIGATSVTAGAGATSAAPPNA